jgi:rhodanese-related sulfurtransferase
MRVDPRRTPVREIAIEDVEAAVAGGATLVDVREPMEYVVAHLPGAVLVPMAQVTGRIGEIDRDRPVLVVCATGNRSGAICDLLRAAGYDARNVVGGTTAWQRSGRPVETGLEPAPGAAR